MLNMESVLEQIFLAFKEISNELIVNGEDFSVPKYVHYWHVDNIPFLIRKNEKSVTVESHKGFPKKILIKDNMNKEDIIKVIYKNFI